MRLTIDSDSTEYTLTTRKDGMRILTIPMTERDSIAVAVWSGIGSRYETPRQAGLSHFLEHMLFKGTRYRSGRAIRQSIEGVGGVLNAFTGEEGTCYFVKILRPHLRMAVELLSDMMYHATLDAQDIAKERAVILEEIKMYRDLPSHLVHDMMNELLWPNHSLGRPISGTPETVSTLTQNDLLKHYRKYYFNSNLLLCVSGNIHHEDVVEFSHSFFPESSVHQRFKFAPVLSRQTQPRVSFLEKQTEQTHLVIGFRTVSRFHPDRYKMAMLNVIMGANMSSRLFETIREKKGLAYEIRSSAGFYHDTGFFTITAGVENSHLAATIEVILEELRKIAKNGVTKPELERAKQYFQSQFCMALEDTLDHLLWASERVMDVDELPEREMILQSINRVTPDDVQKIAGSIFRNQNLNLALIGPVGVKKQNEIQNRFYLK